MWPVAAINDSGIHIRHSKLGTLHLAFEILCIERFSFAGYDVTVFIYSLLEVEGSVGTFVYIFSRNFIFGNEVALESSFYINVGTSHEVVAAPVCAWVAMYGECYHRIALSGFCDILNLEDGILVIVLVQPALVPGVHVCHPILVPGCGIIDNLLEELLCLCFLGCIVEWEACHGEIYFTQESLGCHLGKALVVCLALIVGSRLCQVFYRILQIGYDDAVIYIYRLALSQFKRLVGSENMGRSRNSAKESDQVEVSQGSDAACLCLILLLYFQVVEVECLYFVEEGVGGGYNLEVIAPASRHDVVGKKTIGIKGGHIGIVVLLAVCEYPGIV